MSQTVAFYEASNEAQKATCREIRRVVFVEGQGVPLQRELKDEERPCRHFYGVTPQKEAVAALRVMYDGDTAKIQRMAVLPSYRGQGVGSLMLDFVLAELAKDKALRRAILGSQDHAVAFYRKAGFKVIGDAFEDAGITHYLMEKALS